MQTNCHGFLTKQQLESTWWEILCYFEYCQVRMLYKNQVQQYYIFLEHMADERTCRPPPPSLRKRKGQKRGINGIKEG